MNSQEKWAFLAGALRDGSFIKNTKYHTYRIVIYQKNKEWINYVSKILYDITNKEPTIVQDNRGLWRVMINSKEIFYKATKILEWKGRQQEWNIPSFVLKGTKKVKKESICGFFGAEGSISHPDAENKNVRIYFAQANKQVLIDLKKLLKEFNVSCGTVCGPYIKKGTKTKMYGLIIHGIKPCLFFYTKIGTHHPEKQSRFGALSTRATKTVR